MINISTFSKGIALTTAYILIEISAQIILIENITYISIY